MAVLGALGDLVLALSADTAKFQSDLGRAQRIGEKFGREVGRAIGNIAGALVALGGAAGFGGLVRGQIDAADAAGKMSQKIGVAVEDLSAYIVAASLSNVSNEQLQTGFVQLAKNQADFVAGTGEAAAAFTALGISQEQVKALNGDNAKLFDLVAGKLASFEDGANKTALAVKIFGRSGAELIPLINGLEETRKEAALLGAIIDKDTSEAANRFNDNMTRVGVSVQAMGLNVARVVLPTLEMMSARLVQAASDAEGMDRAGRIADTGLRLLATAGTVIATTFDVAGKAIGSVAAALVQAAQGNFRQAWLILTEGGIDMKKSVTGAITSLEETWDSTGDKIKAKAPQTAKKIAAPALQSAEMVKAAAKAQHDAIMGLYNDAIATIDADKEISRRIAANLQVMADDQQRINEGWIPFEAENLATRIEDTSEKGKEFAKIMREGLEGAAEAGRTFADVVAMIGARLGKLLFDRFVGDPFEKALAGALPNFNFSSVFAGGTPAGAGALDLSGFDFSGIPVYAKGTNYVPEDGLAYLHEGEQVVPAEHNRPGGGVTINQNIHVDSRSDASSIRAAMVAAKDAAVAEVAAHIDRGNKAFRKDIA